MKIFSRILLALELFGPLLAALACQPPARRSESGALRTGQSVSVLRHDDAWHAARGVGKARRFVRNADGTVTDLDTGLMWVRDPGRCGAPLGIDGEARGLAYSAAARACDALQFANHDDWRLPTAEELSTLIDAGRSDPSVDSRFFACVSAAYWTSTRCAPGGPKGVRWAVSFDDGAVRALGLESLLRYVRPVRCANGAARPFAPVRHEYSDNGDGTITDKATGLVWVRDPDAADLGGAQTWPQAVRACARLQYAGHGDWRLPNRNELQSLVDYSRSRPAVNTTFFVAAPAGYWSSTTSADNTEWAWAVDFEDGSVSSGAKNYPHHVRPVRDAR